MSAERSVQEWHARYVQQAAWTRDLRNHLFKQVNIGRLRRILDVGCGTGALTAELHHHTRATIYGVDIDFEYLQLAHQSDPSTRYTAGDALTLPFATGEFDLVYCHFVLLWVSNPAVMLSEMRRVTKAGGYVAALAEPDYGGRIDHPPQLARLGQMQGEALRRQGADPNMGRKLGSLFVQAGLADVETGVLGGQWNIPATEAAWESEWAVLEADLASSIPQETLRELRRVDQAAWQHGQRILFVPTFYAWGINGVRNGP